MTNLPKIYIDRPIPEGFDDLFTGRAEVVGPDPSALATADGVLAGASLWDGARMDAAPNLKFISRTGIGYDTVNLADATERGVVVCNAPESPTISTAEHTMALLLHATKSLTANQRRLRNNDGDYYAANESIELCGKTLGLVGYGRIGRRVAKAALGLEMDVIAVDPYIDTDLAKQGAPEIELTTFEDVLARSNVVSLHCPLTEETRELMCAATFAQMQHGAALVNAARGGLVNQDDLIAALESGQVSAAGLDVVVPEPLPVGHPLQGRENVMITPHIASATDLGRRRMYSHAMDNAVAIFAGEQIPSCVNPEVYSAD